MGALSGLFGSMGADVGAAATPGGGAQGAASAGMGSGFLGSLVSGAGDASSTMGQFNQYKYAAEVAHQNADAESRAGLIDSSLTATRYGSLANKQTAEFAGQGVGLSSPTATRVVQGTNDTGRLAAAMEMYNSNRKVWGDLAEAAAYKSAANNALVGGALKTAGGFFGGAAGLSGKWQQYLMSQGGGGAGGAMGNSAGDDALAAFG
jgi:hypothetical protein